MKGATAAMSYERTGSRELKQSALKKLEKATTDITKMSTFSILKHLYKKHETAILYCAVVLCFAWGIGQNV